MISIAAVTFITVISVVLFAIDVIDVWRHLVSDIKHCTVCTEAYQKFCSESLSL